MYIEVPIKFVGGTFILILTALYNYIKLMYNVPILF